MEASTLETLVALSNRQIDLERNIEEQENTIKRLKAQHRTISEIDIPNLMLELGVKEIKLPDGSAVQVKPELDVSILLNDRPEAWEWLTKKGFGGLIKTEIIVAYGKGELDAAIKFQREVIKKYKVDAVMERGVHPQTLKAFAKEQLRDGKDLPSLFNVDVYSKTKIIEPKGK